MAEEPREDRRVSPEQEIKDLEQKLEEKKQMLAEQGKELPQEKEILRGVLREQAEAPKADGTPPEPPLVPQLGAMPPADDTGKKTDDDTKKDEREEEIRALVEYAMAHSISSAVEKASAESPYLLDALHDRLTDEYYDKMIALRKLKQL